MGRRERNMPGLPAESVWRWLLAAGALCALVAIAYGNSLDNGFVWDDHEQIVMNPYMKPGVPVAPFFTDDVRFAHEGPSVQTRVYRPLQLLTYRAVMEGFDGAPEAFHAVSVAFAAAGALAALWVFWLLTRKIGLAFAAAALFAVHPVHTEAVDWIAALPDLGCGLFVLLAFGFFVAGLDSGRRQRGAAWARACWCASLLAFAIALLWKETAVVVPALVAIYAVSVEPAVNGVTRASRAKQALKQSALFWVVLAAYLLVRFLVLGGLSAGPRTWALGPVPFGLTALHLVLSYWAKLVVPAGLNAYHVFHPLRSLAEPAAVGTLLLALACAGGLFFLIRRAPLAGFAALWVCILLLPALNLNGLGRNPFAERYLYVPSAGFCLLAVLAAAWCLGRLPQGVRRYAGVGLLVVVVGGCVAETVDRNAVWKDDRTLFAATLQRSPDAAFVRNMVAASESEDRSQSSTAEGNYEKAALLAQEQVPVDRLDAVAAYKGLASLDADRGQYDRALEVLGQARRMAPGDPDILGEEGTILARAGHGAEAEALLNQALAAQPNNENVLSALALIAREQHHDLARAAELFSRALAVHPQQDAFAAAQHNYLGAVYGEEENFPAAVAELRQAVANVPDDAEFHSNLASALAGAGQFDQARMEAETALRIAPDDGNAREILQRLAQTK